MTCRTQQHAFSGLPPKRFERPGPTTDGDGEALLLRIYMVKLKDCRALVVPAQHAMPAGLRDEERLAAPAGLRDPGDGALTAAPVAVAALGELGYSVHGTTPHSGIPDHIGSTAHVDRTR
jgi:hypothetical protein